LCDVADHVAQWQRTGGQALIAIKRNDWQVAERTLGDALALCRVIHYPYGEAKVLYFFGQLHAARGAPQLASERLQPALVILNQLGERIYAEHVERMLAALE
jgi:hypothetical protein